jgi:membrane protease subunit HflC
VVSTAFIRDFLIGEADIASFSCYSKQSASAGGAFTLDNYAKWRITDPLAFYQSLKTIPGAQATLKQIIQSEQLVVVGTYDLTEVVSTKRHAIMEKVKAQANEAIKKQQLGTEVVDVRIKRTDLLPANQKAIFDRMTAERELQAMEYHSEGKKDADIIKSTTDRERALILAEARKQSEILRGKGDADATRIFADAISQAPEFYEFVPSLEAYKKSLGTNTRLILSPDNEFLKFLRQLQ